MQNTIVALDLETTGFDSSYDHIIEIAAVKFQGDEILDEYQTLIDPGISIPWRITQLTGITTRDVTGAPRISDQIPGFRKFIGNDPILGHSIGFDLNFLEANGLYLRNPVLDTYAISSTLLPQIPRYNLSAIATELDVWISGAHRALNDVYMTVGVYQALWKKVSELPLEVLSEIVRLGRNMPWKGELFFQAALEQQLQDTSHHTKLLSPAEFDQQLSTLFTPSDPLQAKGLKQKQTLIHIDVEQIAAGLEPGGNLDQQMPDFEYREQQVSMLCAVGNALNNGQHLLIEAPTGVGKSLGYLIPAAHFAVENDCRVVISTNTINLQDQLVNKDIPLLQKSFNIPVRAAILKGRANYLCPRRFATLRRRGPTSPDEMQILARLLVWTSTNQSGDRGEITLRGPAERAIWRQLSAEDEGCKLSRCITQMGGGCPFYQARQTADSAHILIVNHSLLLSDVMTEGRVLPEYRYLIVDEAHHLEEAITNGLSFRTDPPNIRRQIGELGSPTSGLLGEVLFETQGAIPDGYHQTLSGFVASVTEAASFMAQHTDHFFTALLTFLKQHTNLSNSDYVQSIRIVDNHRQQPDWLEVEKRWDNLSQFTSVIATAMSELVAGLHDLDNYDIDQYDDLLAGAGSAAHHLEQLHMRLEELVMKPDSNIIYWIELMPDGERISLHAAPLDVGPMMQQHIWHQKESVILTSATLRTNDSFAYIRDRLDADDVDEFIVDSPFDYHSNTLLYLVEDIPEPNNRAAYQKAVEEGLLGLCLATEGRTLVLFTSYAQLQQTSRAISDDLNQADIAVYDQTIGVSRGQLVDNFISSQKSVLMGTRSFWEGVDIPGIDLSVLVIVRLPFNVPTDPLFAARSNQFSNPFMEYAVPEAILRFRQGFGRLIRRKDDRGVVAIFDKRIISKRYGTLFLDALPDCTTRTGKMKDLPDMAVRWIDV